MHLSTIIFIFCCEIEISSFLKKIAANFDSVSLLSGYVGIQIKSLFFSNRDLSFDRVSKIPAFMIILILFIFLSIKSCIVSKIFSDALFIIKILLLSNNDPDNIFS